MNLQLTLKIRNFHALCELETSAQVVLFFSQAASCICTFVYCAREQAMREKAQSYTLNIFIEIDLKT